MTTEPRILVAGIGNIFLGDDAFGSEVAQRLLHRPHAENVRIVDFGIRGLDLAYALLDTCDAAILVDAVSRPNEPPGTLFVLEPLLETSSDAPIAIDAHLMDPVKVLQTAFSMGAKLQRVLIIGCQPANVPSEADDGTDMLMEMSAPVAAAIDGAIALVESLINELSSKLLDNPQEAIPCTR
jgi:hydrogenase maturation protease